MNSIFHRVSVRQYQQKDVEQEKIELMLRAAMQAPSAQNQQPWEFYVVTDRKVLSELSETAPYAKPAQNAPLAFVACYQKDCVRPQFVEIDLSAAVENLLLEADSLGLGAVWLGIAPIRERMDAVAKVIALPERLEAFAIIACGYPANNQKQISRFDESKIHYVR